MRRRILLFLILAALAVSFHPAGAQSGGDYELTWLTIDGGGVTIGAGAASGGVYQLQGTIGQPDAALSSGGVYSLRSGFWVAATYRAFLPVTLR